MPGDERVCEVDAYPCDDRGGEPELPARECAESGFQDIVVKAAAYALDEQGEEERGDKPPCEDRDDIVLPRCQMRLGEEGALVGAET